MCGCKRRREYELKMAVLETAFPPDALDSLHDLLVMGPSGLRYIASACGVICRYDACYAQS